MNRSGGDVVLTVRSDTSIGGAVVERFEAAGAWVHAAEGEPDRHGLAVRDCVDRFGGLDVLAIPPPDAVVETYPNASSDDHRAAVETVLRTAFFTAQHALRAMRQGGRICITAPRRPPEIPFGTPPPATLVEGGLIALTRLIAVEVAPLGVTVNALCPVGPSTDPGRVAAALAFLASTEASYVSGVFVPIIA